MGGHAPIINILYILHAVYPTIITVSCHFNSPQGPLPGKVMMLQLPMQQDTAANDREPHLNLICSTNCGHINLATCY